MRSRVDAHTHGEAYLSEPYRPWGVSNIKAIYPLIPGARRPLLRRSLLRRRIIPGYLRTSSPLAGPVPSVVFPSHGYRGTTLSAATWRFNNLVSLHSLPYLWVSGRRRLQGLASAPSISSPSTLFPTCGYRGDDASADVWIGDGCYILALASLSAPFLSGRRLLYWRRILSGRRLLSWRRLMLTLTLTLSTPGIHVLSTWYLSYG